MFASLLLFFFCQIHTKSPRNPPNITLKPLCWTLYSADQTVIAHVKWNYRRGVNTWSLLSTKSCRQAFPLSGTMQCKVVCSVIHIWVWSGGGDEKSTLVGIVNTLPPPTWLGKPRTVHFCLHLNRTLQTHSIAQSNFNLCSHHTSMSIVQCQMLSECENSYFVTNWGQLCMHFQIGSGM